MFCSRSTNKKINKLHEKALRVVYDHYNSKLEKFLTKYGSFTIYHQNIQTLAIEMFKIRKEFSQVVFLELFITNVTFTVYDLKSILKFLKGIEPGRQFTRTLEQYS